MTTKLKAKRDDKEYPVKLKTLMKVTVEALKLHKKLKEKTGINMDFQVEKLARKELDKLSK